MSPFSVCEMGNDQTMSLLNCAMIAVDMDALVATTVATILERLVGFRLGLCGVLIVYAYLLEFCHDDTSLL